MGVTVDNIESERKVAQLKCNGGLENCSDRFVYEGIKDCKSCSKYFKWTKSCDFACLGFGTCARSLSF